MFRMHEVDGGICCRRIVYFALFAAFLLAAANGMFSFGVQDNNEGLYATIAKEMLVSGEWVVPHLNGVPYLEKPPLLYWMVALSMSVFGQNEEAVRLVPVLFLAGTVLGLMQLLRQMGRPQASVMAAAVLLSCGGFIAMSRSLLFDVPMTTFLMWSLVCLHADRLRQDNRALWLFYICLALGVLAKGPTALVLGGGCAVVFTLWLERSPRKLLRIFNPLGLALFLVLTAPWHILAELRHPGFSHFYFVNEHVLRFLDLRKPHDYYRGPFYYYLVRLPMYLGLWTAFLPLLWLGRRSKEQRNEQAPAERAGRLLLWVSILLPLVFFSVSKAKANYYLLPSIPGFAALLALAWPGLLEGWRGRRFTSVLLRLLMVVGIVAPLAAVVAVVFSLVPQPWGSLLHSPWLWAGLLMFSVGAISAFPALRCGNAYAALAAVCVVGLSPWLMAPKALEIAEETISNREVADFIRSEPANAVVFFRDYEYMSSLGFYLSSPVPIVDSRSNDLYYAYHLKRYPAVFISSDDFVQLSSRQKVFLVMRKSEEKLAQQQYADSGFQPVRTFRRLVVLSNENAGRLIQPAAGVVATAAAADTGATATAEL